jgi:hypothetical protein
MRILFDLEADGLLDTITQIHCLVALDLDTQKIYRFYDGDIGEGAKPTDLPIKDIPRIFKASTLAVGHNIIRYDLEVLKRFLGLEQSFTVHDTLVWSKTLNPDRAMPKGCPPVIYNPITEKYDKIGPHSIAAWGYRVGRGKPEYFDWKEFDAAMLHRCEEDVNINMLVYLSLLEEAGMTLDDA